MLGNDNKRLDDPCFKLEDTGLSWPAAAAAAAAATHLKLVSMRWQDISHLPLGE
ncbi:hypothetical protein INR49_021344, partial [Caranx melampygus]